MTAAAKERQALRGQTRSATNTWPERASLFLLIAILAWAQFPLGSNRPWSWSLLVLLIAADLCVWLPLGIRDFDATVRFLKRAAVADFLMIAVLAWAFVQSAGFTPASWHNPVWLAAQNGLHRKLSGAISVDPFVTRTEAMKLCAYVTAGALAGLLSLRVQNARRLLAAVALIGTAYAVYGIVLSALSTSQVAILEGVASAYGRDVTSGFVSKNSFATFTGISLLASLALLADEGRQAIVASRGWRTHLRTLILYATGRGSLWLASSLVLFGALVASDSRAGLMSCLVGLFVVFILAVAVAAGKSRLRWTLTGGALAGVAIFALFVVNGETLQSRFENLIETRGHGELRPLMWDAALRAIEANPWSGTGLGTYRDVYPGYAQQFVPYVVDRVHNDYLELALGLGIPAAVLWLLALCFLVGQCAWGIFRRRRRRLYAMTAVGATALVGFHALFDFSLQMPAVALFYAVVLGIGLGQSQPSREVPDAPCAAPAFID